MSEVILESGHTRLALRPDFGGAIARYWTDTGAQSYEWLRPLASATSDVRAAACFPLVPFSGRIRDGRFRFGDRNVQLPLNFPPERHAIHGHGWQAGWTAADASATRAVLEHLHEADSWPWTYLARQSFELQDEILLVTISVANRSATAMPAGIGLHPYFVRTPGSRIEASVRDVWATDEEVMPLERVPAPPDYPLEQGFEPASRSIDNAFSGWNGSARIDWPEWDAALDIEAEPPLLNLVVYAPSNEDFFCVEPVSNTTDAFNMLDRGEDGHGTIVLAPGESVSARVRFRPDH